MKTLFYTLWFLFFLGPGVFSQEVIRLYDGPAPGSEDWDYKEIEYMSPGNRPDFAAPIYGGWKKGTNVPEDGPPLFILAAADDRLVSGSLELYQSWIDAGGPAELHIYSKGGHGFGMNQRGMPVDSWIERFFDWLIETGF